MNRRLFLASLGTGLGSTILAACNSEGPGAARALLRGAERRNESLERWLFSGSARDRVAADAHLAGDAFPSYFVSPKVPVWDAALRGVWRLQVDGAVRRPLSLSLDDLVAMRGVSQRVNHFCVEGWNARAEFRGVRLSALAALAGVTGDAAYVDFQSFDSAYHESWDLESAMHPQTIVAYAREGHYLGAMQGAPARVHSPVKLGYKNTKYLTRIVFLPERNGGYWSDRGYEWYGGV
jgi:DMSO/TMAO reductase YedYZ molybdopterin-dependent catalytic subunit